MGPINKTRLSLEPNTANMLWAGLVGYPMTFERLNACAI